LLFADGDVWLATRAATGPAFYKITLSDSQMAQRLGSIIYAPNFPNNAIP